MSRINIVAPIPIMHFILPFNDLSRDVAKDVVSLKELVEKYKKDNDDYNAIMAEALADRLAEAFAECLHKQVREEWGYGKMRVVLADLRDGKPVRKICVLAHDGRELRLHDLTWVDRDGERLSIPTAAE